MHNVESVAQHPQNKNYEVIADVSADIVKVRPKNWIHYTNNK